MSLYRFLFTMHVKDRAEEKRRGKYEDIVFPHMILKALECHKNKGRGAKRSQKFTLGQGACCPSKRVEKVQVNLHSST